MSEQDIPRSEVPPPEVPLGIRRPDTLEELADAMAIMAEHSGLPAALIVVADNAGHVHYRSRLGYEDLNRLLDLVGQRLNESDEVPR